MAAGVSDLIPSNLESLWASSRNSPDEENPPQIIEEAFQRNLLDISEFCSCEETVFLAKAEPFIQACLKAITSDLEAFTFPLSKEASDTLDRHLDLFDRIAHGIKGLEENPEGKSCENSLIRLQFRKSCADLIEKKWAHSAAKSFYDLLLLSNRKERIQAAQVWTRQLLKDIPYLGNLKHSYFFKTVYPETFAQSVEKAFSHQYNEALKQRWELIEKNSKLDPNFLERRVEAARKKLQDDPSSLSPEEMTTLGDFFDAISYAFSRTYPIAECKLKLVFLCIFNGHTLQGIGVPLGEDRMSEMRFRDIFSNLEALEDTWIFD